MADVFFVGLTIVFFAVAIAYIYGCQYFIKVDKAPVATQRIETTSERTATPGPAV